MSTCQYVQSCAKVSLLHILGIQGTHENSPNYQGVKTVIIIRGTDEHGVKTKRTEQVRYMLMSLKEAYNKFNENNSNTKQQVL